MNILSKASKALRIKGSVLVFSLIVLAFMLISALSLSIVSVTDKRSSFATERSSRSFQVADSGVEIILQKIYKGSYANMDLLAQAAGASCDSATGKISGILNAGTYTVSFYDNSGNQLTDCTDISWRDQVVQIRSEGVSGNTIRAVSVAVAANNAFEAKAWVRYKQTSSPQIEASYNVSNAVIGAGGDSYKVTFITPLSSNKYAVICNAYAYDSGSSSWFIAPTYTNNMTQQDFTMDATSGSSSSVRNFDCVVFGN